MQRIIGRDYKFRGPSAESSYNRGCQNQRLLADTKGGITKLTTSASLARTAPSHPLLDTPHQCLPCDHADSSFCTSCDYNRCGSKLHPVYLYLPQAVPDQRREAKKHRRVCILDPCGPRTPAQRNNESTFTNGEPEGHLDDSRHCNTTRSKVAKTEKAAREGFLRLSAGQ